jgi:hypothetical protein
MNRQISKPFEGHLADMTPIIVVGMHRSGTSLLTRLLGDLDVHMGTWLSRDAEAVFFQRINRAIYQKQNAFWAEPEQLLAAMRSEEFVIQQTQFVQERLRGKLSRIGFPPAISRHFGTKKWQTFKQKPDFPWGWKDPRTALVIPIWAEIFPNARWVHIVRDGVDVAISLYRRALQQQKKWVRRLYRFDYSERTLDFPYCFQLWEVYLSSITQALAPVDRKQRIQLQYEDLLADPSTELSRIMAYFQMTYPRAGFVRACARVNPANLNNRPLRDAFRKQIQILPESAWMERFGYGGNSP